MRRSNLLILPIAGLAAAGTLAACGGDIADDGELNVVAAFYPLAYAAEEVGGDRVNVTNLTPAGQEPHDLELSPSDVAAIEQADFVVYLGDFIPELDAAIDEYAADKSLDVASIVDTIGYDDTEVIEGDHVEDEHAEADHEHAEEDHATEDHSEEDHAAEEDHDHGDELTGTDPHIWLDPVRYAAIGQVIASELSAIDADGDDIYTAGAEAFTAALNALDAEFTEGLASRTSDVVVTSHAAFGYLADRYGLHQLAISGLSPDQEPDTQRMADVADYVQSNGVTTIFFETLVSPDIAETLAAETGAETAVLNPLEGLTEEEIDGGASYFTVMRGNLAALQTALGAA